MIVLFNDHELLGRLLVKEAIIRRKQSNRIEVLNVRKTKVQMTKMQCMPCEIFDNSAVKPKKDALTIR